MLSMFWLIPENEITLHEMGSYCIISTRKAI